MKPCSCNQPAQGLTHRHQPATMLGSGKGPYLGSLRNSSSSCAQASTQTQLVCGSPHMTPRSCKTSPPPLPIPTNYSAVPHSKVPTSDHQRKSCLKRECFQCRCWCSCCCSSMFLLWWMITFHFGTEPAIRASAMGRNPAADT